MTRILIIDDEQSSSRTLNLHFSQLGFDVETAEGADEGFAKLQASPADVVISDIRMPGRDGLSLLKEIREHMPTVPVIMITAFHDMDSTVAAMHGGAVDYIQKPINLEELEAAVDRAVNMRAGGTDDVLLVGAGDSMGPIVGRSHLMKEAFKTIGMVSQSRVTVLILGESGTGKELVARAIHSASPDAKEPFIAVNCAALVETLLESELFGHEKGSFTGAVAARKGKVELAGEGALFLDEISELSARMQGKLLRLLEEREFTPVGGNRVSFSRARFLAATNVDLAEQVATGAFRKDLYYRLNVVSITLPPLSVRREDIPLLVEHLLKKINKEIRKGIRRVPAEVMDALVSHDWPGNVRQLENVLMKAVVMSQGDALSMDHLPNEIRQGSGVSFLPSIGPDTGGESHFEGLVSLKELERRHIQDVLERTGWHKGKTCEILAISRPRLERRIKEYKLAPGRRVGDKD